MNPESYRRIARLLRAIAERLEAFADDPDYELRRTVTARLYALQRSAPKWWSRHMRTVRATEQGRSA